MPSPATPFLFALQSGVLIVNKYASISLYFLQLEELLKIDFDTERERERERNFCEKLSQVAQAVAATFLSMEMHIKQTTS